MKNSLEQPNPETTFEIVPTLEHKPEINILNIINSDKKGTIENFLKEQEIIDEKNHKSHLPN